MSRQDGFQELVVLFDGAGSKVQGQLRHEQFERMLGQRETLSSHAASTVKAAYVQVGPGLTVRALVFFLFKVNEEGAVDPAFNLPLDYMAQNAGAGPDLGMGPVAMACRSQCPVPWHAINMWEPAGEGEAHPAMTVQKLVWRNKLGLKPAPVLRTGNAVAALRVREAKPLDAVQELEQAINGRRGLPERHVMEEKLTATFGESGRVSVRQYTQQHREQVGQITDQFRGELARQQQAYLEQIKSCREEIQRLKSALRGEQERNRRLQQLLRGDL